MCMKDFGRIASLVLALVLTLALGAPALAEETYSITINNAASGHVYEAYQIFRGVLSDGVLTDVEWGGSVSGVSALPDAGSVAERLDVGYAGENKLDVDDLLAMISLDNPVADSGETRSPYVISGLTAGYYLVKDRDGTLTGSGDVYTEYIIKVVGNVSTQPKSDAPRVEKKVKDVNDSVDEELSGWQDAADYDIGDSVPFLLKATLAGNVSAYETYEVVFHDTLSAGLTYNGDAKAYLDGALTEDFSIAATAVAGGTALTVSCDDVKRLGAEDGSVITVEYTATLNSQAAHGAAGNRNDVLLEYSNNPYGEETGKTPKDTVVVFTYRAVVNKVAPNPEYDQADELSEEWIPLSGAAFLLEKYDKAEGKWVEIEAATDESGTVFTFTGLDDGKYRLTEARTPSGYNSIDPIEFIVTAEHDVESDSPALKSLNGDVTTGELSFSAETQTGTLTTDVVNRAGALLPETGGVGATVFYAAGGVLIVAALAALIARRRANRAG